VHIGCIPSMLMGTAKFQTDRPTSRYSAFAVKLLSCLMCVLAAGVLSYTSTVAVVIATCFSLFVLLYMRSLGYLWDVWAMLVGKCAGNRDARTASLLEGHVDGYAHVTALSVASFAQTVNGSCLLWCASLAGRVLPCAGGSRRL
jgi:hypothetical protein